MDKYSETFNTWNKIAQLYQDQFMHLDLYNDSYDLFCDMLKPNASLLEIGCGPGNITQYLLAKKPGLNVLGLDVAPNMVQLAKQNNPTAEFKVMDCRELDQLTNKYDALLCGFCLPYLSREDVEGLMIQAKRLLHHTGVFYLSAIEGDYERSGFEAGSSGHRTYVYYYEEDYLVTQLQNNGFKVLHLLHKHFERSNGGQQTHLIIIAQLA